MARYSGTVTDQNNVPIPGARVLVQLSSSGDAASLSDDSGGFLPNPIVTDALGSFVFNTADGLYDLTYQASKGGRIISRDYGVIIGAPPVSADVNAAITSAIGAQAAATTSQIAALTTTSIGEGTRLYFTPARAQAAITGSTSIGVAGGVVSQSKSQLDAGAGGTVVTTNAPYTFTQPIKFAGDPIDPLGAATKQYVDARIANQVPKASVARATTGNITLSGIQTVDGVSGLVGQRTTVKDQTDQTQNGIWIEASGAWARATDMDLWSEVPGATTFVLGGTVNGNTNWTCTSSLTGIIGSTAVTWTQTSALASYTATGGITKTGSQFSLTPAAQGTVLGTAASGGTVAPTAQTIPTILGYTPFDKAGGNVLGSMNVLGNLGALTSGNGRAYLTSGGPTSTGALLLQDKDGNTTGQVNQGSGALRITTSNGDQIWANGGRIWDDVSIVGGKDLTLTPPTGSAVTTTTPMFDSASYGVGRQFAQFSFYNPRINYSLTSSYGATTLSTVSVVSRVGGTSYGAGGSVYEGVSSNVIFDAASPNATNSNTVSVTGRAIASANGATANGNMNLFGLHSYVGGDINAKNVNIVGLEIDCGLNSTQATATGITRYGIIVGSMGSPKGAAGNDASIITVGLPQYQYGYQQNDGPGKAGWRDGWLIAPFGDVDYCAPIATDGTIIRASGNWPAKDGINFTTVNFSGAAFRSPNFFVNNNEISHSATDAFLELGNPTGANTPGIIFHSSFTPSARDAGIYASGGSGTVDTAALTFRCDTAVFAASAIRPNAPNTVTVGNAGFPFAGGFTQTAFVVTSDKRLKTAITDLDPKWLDFLSLLRPVSFQLKGGSRSHVGFVAQEVRAALKKARLDNEGDTGKSSIWALFVYDPSEDLYALRYEEFTALLALGYQSLHQRISRLEAA